MRIMLSLWQGIGHLAAPASKYILNFTMSPPPVSIGGAGIYRG